MTDGQSFYLVLAIFYLIECVKFAPPGSTGLASHFGGFGKCSPRAPFMTAWGVRKAVFLAPILPWPGSMYIVSGYDRKHARASPVETVSSIAHHHRFLRRASSLLRTLAMLNLLNFFAFLPVLYVQTYDEKTILYCLAYSYVTLFATAVHYRSVHKRLFPSHKAERFKTTIYTALLPWHAARCADEIYLTASRRWNPIAALAANARSEASLALLQQHWRNAHFLPHPPFSLAEIATALDQAGLDSSSWLEPRQDLASPQYCPCCLSAYEKQATHCSDCKGIKLRSR